MKKSKLLIAPLLVVPFLASCGGGSKPDPQPEEYKVSIPSIDGLTISETKVTKGKDYVGTIAIDTTMITDKLLPDTLTKVTSDKTELVANKDYTYTLKEDKSKADFKIPAANIVGDVTIQLSLVDAKKWFDYEDWWNYCSSNIPKSKATTEDIGHQVNLTVNNQVHKVRLIGLDHDELASENGTAHCTFEFENLITDASGNALTTKWDSSNNYNFPKSTLNTFLNGTEESNDDSVLNMLPSDLQSVIQEVQKPIATRIGSSYELTTYDTKLFPLSYREIIASGSDSDQGNEGTAYAFYTDTGDTDSNRVKKKVGGTGVYYWLRSPSTTTSVDTWFVNGDVGGYGTGHAFRSAFAVAPAFCI